MGETYDAWIVVPVQNLTEGRFASVVDRVKEVPNVSIGDFSPPDTDAPLFTTTDPPYIEVMEGEVTIHSSTQGPEWPEDARKGTEDAGFIVFGTEGGFLDDDLDAQEAFFGLMKGIFEGMGGLFGVSASEHWFDEVKGISDLRKAESGGPLLFSRDLAALADLSVLFEKVEHGELEGGGLYISPGPEYYFGYTAPIHSTLSRIMREIWSKCPPLNGGRPVGTPVKEIPSGSWWFLTEEDPPSDHLALKQFAAPSKQAFLWFHFPKANFTIEACKAFNTEVLLFDKSAVKGASVFDIARIEAQSQELLEGYTSYQSFEMPLTYPMVTSSTVNLHFAVTSGTERMKSLGPTLERQGQVGLLVFFQGECGEMRSIESLKAFESVFGLVVAHFKPTYGFGFRGFNRFVEIYRTMGNAEDRVWPWNVWDLSANPTFLIRNLKRFSSANKKDWALTVIDDRFATLMARNSTLMDTNVDASITKAVLVKRLFG